MIAAMKKVTCMERKIRFKRKSTETGKMLNLNTTNMKTNGVKFTESGKCAITERKLFPIVDFNEDFFSCKSKVRFLKI